MKCEICGSTKFTIYRHIRQTGGNTFTGCVEIKCGKGHNQPMPPPLGFKPDNQIDELYLGRQTKPYIRLTKYKGELIKREWLYDG